MTFIPPGEKVLETRVCRLSKKEFVITDKDALLLDKMSPVIAGKVFPLPFPTLHPDLRMARKLAFRNEMRLYKRTCDVTKQPIISIYSADKNYTVYNQKLWWSDDWDACSFGQEYSFDKTFFEQFDALMHRVPLLGSTVMNSENSEYCNDTGDCKNCYLCLRTYSSQDCYYSYWSLNSQNCYDCHQVEQSSYLYECFQCENCHRGMFLSNCVGCSDASFLDNCRNCQDCFMCFGLEGKQYYILGKEYTKEVYKEKIKEYENWTDEKLTSAKKYFLQELQKNTDPSAFVHVNSENCLWNELIWCRDCVAAFHANDCANCRYTWDNIHFKDSMDNYSGFESELCYETTANKSWYKTHFSLRTRYSPECMYCFYCYHCDHCFGCISLRNKSYCILNIQYTQEEYEALLPKILAHMTTTKEWGEFFPFSLSTFGYNETIAQEYFPATAESITAMGGKWHSEVSTLYSGPIYEPCWIEQYDEKIVGYEIAQKNIDACLTLVLMCEVTKKPFNIVRQELAFYIENKLSLPRICPEQRHKERIALQKPRVLESLIR